MLKRNPNSHKGDNGRVLVIGGNATFHGAPILSALAAEHTGADLVHLALPPEHAGVARTYGLNLIVHPFEKDHLIPGDVKGLLKLAEGMDAVVIGPGLGTEEKTKEAIKTLLKSLTVPTVVDADALLYSITFPTRCVLTPHRGEFKELTGDEATPENVQKWAKALNAVILCKAPKDMIADADHMALNDTGNALMTVGGTGDGLAGVVASLIAQKMSLFDACRLAARLWGKIGDDLSKIQGSLRAMDLIYALPSALLEYIDYD